MCYTAYVVHTEVCLKRPGIGACSEISRAFRCVYREFTPNGRKFQDASPELRAARRGGCSRPRARCGGVRRVEQNQVILYNKWSFRKRPPQTLLIR